MSCGFGSPSAITSPRSTCSPSNTVRWRHFGISSSCFSPCSSGDDQAALALGLLAEADRARVLGEDRRVLRLAGLEQVRHARQTAGDVAGLRGLLRDARDDVADRHLRAVGQAHERARRAARSTAGMSVLAKQTSLPFALSSLIIGRRSLPPRRAASDPCTTVRDRPVTSSTCVGDGDAVDEVLEADEARHLGDHRVGVRIPGRDDLAAGDLVAFASP